MSKKKWVSVIAVVVTMVVVGVVFSVTHKSVVNIPGEEVPLESSCKPTELPTSNVESSESEVVEDVPDNYIKANGNVLTDANGNVFLVRAMGFGNACWSNHETPTYQHNTEEDYARLHELGFNTVRYYLNYGLFEDDAMPYVYKQEAWDWLDQNVAWAKKHNIKILFNMHYPQGGFQSAGNGMDLWLDKNGEKSRLAALWKTIAERYAEEEAVLGYGLVNEPFMPWYGEAESTIAQWSDLAQKLTDIIREVDTNHVIFVEAAFAAKDIYTGTIYQQLNDNRNLVKIDDSCDNVVYEVHYYNPSEFTHMQEDAPVSYLNYPNSNLAITSGERWMGSTYNEVLSSNTSVADNTWKKVETNLCKFDDFDADIFYMSFAATNLNGGKAYYDDASIDLYDADGNFVENVVTFDFSTEQQWYNYYSADGAGSAVYVSDDGHDENGCIAIEGANFFSSVGKSVPIDVLIKDGYQYKLSVWVKAETSAEALLYPQFSICKGIEVMPYTSEYLNSVISQYKRVTDGWNAPLFLGEFGVLEETYNGHGGAQWIKDMVNACANQSVGFSQHLYHMEGFGLYTNSQYLLPNDVNVDLQNVIYEVVKPLQKWDDEGLWE